MTMILCAALVTSAQGNSWTKVRYNGGSVPSKVDPKDWNNKLTITPDMILLECKDGVKVGIPPKTVTSLSYGQEAHRRVGTMVALAILIAPVALFGLLHKTRLHYIGIQYNGADAKKEGILLQGDKDNYRAILVALQGVTGVAVSVAEKDREFVPVGVRADVVKDQPEQTAENKTGGESNGPKPSDSTEAKGTVNLVSTPTGADVLVDGRFVGNTPAALKLSAGAHTIAVKSAGYKDWSRDISVESGSDVQLNAVLDKIS
jgi:hypothetical protein